MNRIDDPTIYGPVHETTVPLPKWIDGKTRYQAVIHGVKKYGRVKGMGRREFLPNGKRGKYIWDDNVTVLRKMNQFALGLKTLGFKKGDMFGFMSKNRPEWTIADIACSTQGYVSVPIYDSYGEANCEFIISSTNQVCIFTSKDHIPFIKKACEQCKTVRRVILFDGTPPDEEYIDSVNGRDPNNRREISQLGFTDLYSEIMKIGEDLFKKDENQRIEDPSVKCDDLGTIVFTSGTQGTPKGAMLGHNALLKGALSLIGRFSNYPFEETYISYLPLAHIFERNIQIMALSHGVGIGFYSGSIKGLTEDLLELRPTLMPAVPRVLSKIFSTVQAKVQEMNFINRSLFKTALFLRRMERDHSWPTYRLSQLVLGKIEGMLGGKVRMIFCGSAPLSKDVANFFDLVVGEQVLEGYGCTEACGASCAILEVDHNYGTVGVPHPGVHMRLMSVPEMNYRVTDKPPTGEICINGAGLFLGYYNDPETTAEALRDGWLHTGDVGMYLPNDNLKVIDRLRNVFKLQQGEYVYLDEIERCMSASTIVQQIFIHGTPSMNSLVAIVVPFESEMIKWGKEHNIITGDTPADYEKVCASPEANKYILDHIQVMLREHNRKGYEIPRSIYISTKEFSIENNQLTPTMKTRREVVKKAYAKELAQLSAQYES